MNGMVILNYNDWPTVLDYLKLVTRYRVIDKIVVVDNCSTDGSWDHFLKSDYKSVDFIKSEKNNGYSAGNNLGVKHLINNYENVDKIIISNPDIYVLEDDIKQILDAVTNEYVLATGLIYNSDKLEQKVSLASNWGWKVPSYKDMICNCFLSTYKLSREVLKKGIYYNISDYSRQKIIDVEAVPGCFFAINRDFFESIGLFDESVFLFGEETILGFQIKKNKKKACVVNQTRILHKQSTSINKSIKKEKQKNKYLLDSFKIYLEKYLNCKPVYVTIYQMLFNIGLIEKRIISALFIR